MGLDMYYYAEKEVDTSDLGIPYDQEVVLNAKHDLSCWEEGYQYVGGWDFGNGPDPLYARLLELTGFPRNEGSPSLLVCPHAVLACVAYWRKANQVHAWFVEKVQNGIDECQMSPVTIEQMSALVMECRKALESRDPYMLPPQSGFFFGSTEIDEYYWQDLQDTVDQLAPLAEFGGRMYYRSSW